jgi:hypothetical protein
VRARPGGVDASARGPRCNRAGLLEVETRDRPELERLVAKAASRAA